MSLSFYRFGRRFTALVALLFVVSFSLVAQHSLYDDAFELARLQEVTVNNFIEIYNHDLDFFIESATANMPEFEPISDSDDPDEAHLYKLDLGDPYELDLEYHVEDIRANDSIVVQFGKQRRVFTYQQDHTYDTLTIYSSGEADSFELVIDSYSEEGNWEKFTGISYQPVSYRQNLLLVAPLVAEEEYRSGSLTQSYKVEQALINNPFFPVRGYTNLLNEGALQWYHDDQYYFGEPAQRRQRLFKDYPYTRFVLQDTVLDARNRLAITTTQASYRQRIVTAQDELKRANSDLSQQEKQRRGGLNANTIAVGLSDFIAKRAQEELNMRFFDRFRDRLGDSTELTVLFPDTRNLMFKFELTNYKTFLAHARHTFQNDLDNLGLNLPGILELPKYRALRDDPTVFNLSLIYSVADLAYREQPVENILLASLQNLQQRTLNLDQSINLAIADSLLAGHSLYADRRQSLQRNYQTYLTYLGQIEDKLFDIGSSVNDELDSLSFDPYYQLTGRADKAASAHSAKSVYLENVLDEQLPESLASVNWGDDEVSSVINKYLQAKTSGRDYHAFRLQNYAHPEDFNNYYAKTPLTAEDNITEGITYARRLQRTPLLEKYKLSVDAAEAALDSLRLYESLIRSSDDKKSPDDMYAKLEFLIGREKHLRQAMQQELSSWKAVLGRDETEDHYLGGLFLLDKLVDQAFRYSESLYVGFFLNGQPYTYNRYLKDDPDTRISILQNMSRGDISRLVNWRSNMSNQLTDYYNKWQAQHTRIRKAYAHLPFTQTDTTDLVEYRKFSEAEISFVPNKAAPVLSDVDATIVELRAMIDSAQTIRQALQQTTKSLENLAAPKLVKARTNANNLATIFEISTHLLFAFRRFDHPAPALTYRDTQRITVQVQKSPNATFTYDSTYVVEKFIPGTETDATSRWITRDEFNALRKNPVAMNYFLGLIYQRLRSVPGSPDISTDGLALLVTRFFDIMIDLQDERDVFRRKRAGDPKSISFQDYYPFIRSTVDLFNTVITAPVSPTGKGLLGDSPSLRKLPLISDEALSLYENISLKNYGDAVLNAAELMKVITQYETDEQLSGGFVNTLDGMTKKERRRQISNQKNIYNVFRYGSFMAGMLDARTSGEVESLLRSTTMVPGSSSQKRETVSSFTINSYLGAGAGRDRLLDAPSDISANAFGAALSVPIGLTYSFSPKFLTNYSSFSLHLPLLDLGAITAYRSNPNETADVNNLPELEWRNLFSPGAYLVYNFAKSPFSLGVGGQYGPQLRELEPANGTPIFLNSWRFPMATFTIDVPFFKLFEGDKKYLGRRR